jgi:hypothetical protein
MNRRMLNPAVQQDSGSEMILPSMGEWALLRYVRAENGQLFVESLSMVTINASSTVSLVMALQNNSEL